MKIQVFAALKDHFPSEFTVNDNIETIEALLKHLIRQKADALPLLKRCRFAINNEFVELNHTLTTHDIISIIPPSSGG